MLPIDRAQVSPNQVARYAFEPVPWHSDRRYAIFVGDAIGNPIVVGVIVAQMADNAAR
jgi:hypothetical protein